MHLDQGATYRGRGIVSSPVGVSHENAKSRLEEKGFTNVTVWLAGDHLPADWPAKAVSDESGALSTQVWVEATWGQASGEMAGSGTGWEVVDIWEYGNVGQVPGDPFCGTEGYSCDMNMLGGSTGCCVGQECKQDEANKYGGGPRCHPREADIQIINPVGGGVSWVWWALGIGVVGVAGWWAWPHLAKLFGGSKRVEYANPAVKHNQRDYKYWVVINNLIVTGNEFKEDALDFRRDLDEPWKAKAKVYARAGLRKIGIDPDVNSNWGEPSEWREQNISRGDAERLYEMQELLREAGYDPADARKLQEEGVGPFELADRIRVGHGGIGSLEHSHGMKTRSTVEN